jgi:lysozyme
MKQQLVIGGVVVASASLAAFIATSEGNETTPYRDTGGVWTVCAGVTGPQVIPGRPYTDDECRALNAGAIERHGREVLRCMQGAPLKQHEYEALASLAYNVGSDNVCATCLPGRYCLGDLVRAGRMVEACDRILAYSKVRIRGALHDCRDPASGCRGVALRRQAEHDLCAGQSKPKPPASLGVVG